ncbi:hypothetical protein ACFOY8_14505 [Thalassospira xianhensis]|uniref:DUF7831 domain-containing protein n=1 Tax=Thalassospira xianhensis MCCC 1A02616 TaxID=1177929 RepID=A0A367UH56_9PROT|nr:hypothetical protein [Thalassospira xianhensis]RCK07636.1 hypothetical protein TH5_00740 [Thalassospira xianhensis MCCC 1A02616]
MPVEYRDLYTRDMARAEPDTLFVFGDNMLRKGYKGQAAALRGEPNAVGIPTKNWPSSKDGAYLCNADFDRWKKASMNDWRRLFRHAKQGGTIVWPSGGIGTGYARLSACAPDIAASIGRNLEALENLSQDVTKSPPITGL